MIFTTADLCDAYPNEVEIAEPVFREYGSLTQFAGPIETIRVFEDNAMVRSTLEQDGKGRVLVVDGGGSLRCALVGGRLASVAHQHGWSGILINGCVRDSAELREIPLGIRALSTCPRRSEKAGKGEIGIRVRFAGMEFRPGRFLYADGDGVLLANRELT